MGPDPREEYEAIARGRHPRPFDVLGCHPRAGGGHVVRAFAPRALSLAVERDGESRAAEWVHGDGVFEAAFPEAAAPFPYRLLVETDDGSRRTTDDPYRFGPTLDERALDAWHAGRELRAWERLGAHPVRHEGVDGVRFAVWAPNADRVAVIGSFNAWNGRTHGMRRLPRGVWEIFLPGVAAGALYKFEIRTRHGGRRSVKADPFAFAMELRPSTASVVTRRRARGEGWTDAAWCAERARRQAADAPMSIYEVHLGSWRRGAAGAGAADAERPFLTYRELATLLPAYARDLGFTHLELLPVTEHPFDGSWGYQTVGCFAPTRRFGPPEDLRLLVDAAHRAGLGVILDWVPGHFPRDAHGLGFFDGSHLFEPADPRRGVHEGWGTLVYDFARPEVRSFLLSNALYWLERWHVDGLRVDAVASMLYLNYGRKEGEWVPNAEGGVENWDAAGFLRDLTAAVRREHPGCVLFAEESTSWEGVTHAPETGRKALGFHRKWNMGWMNDTLSFFRRDPLLRGREFRKLTFGLTYAFAERYLLPLSHDEVVHGKASLLSKMPGAAPEQRLAGLRLLLGWMWAHPGKKLLFMGAEIGQWAEWNHDAELDWSLLEHAPHRGVTEWVRALNALYAAEPALHAADDDWSGFEWLDFSDEARAVISFVRRAGKGHDARDIVVCANFAGVPWKGVPVPVPAAGKWRVVLDGDDARFGGGTATKPRAVAASAGADGPAPRIALDLPAQCVRFLARSARR